MKKKSLTLLIVIGIVAMLLPSMTRAQSSISCSQYATTAEIGAAHEALGSSVTILNWRGGWGGSPTLNYKLTGKGEEKTTEQGFPPGYYCEVETPLYDGVNLWILHPGSSTVQAAAAERLATQQAAEATSVPNPRSGDDEQHLVVLIDEYDKRITYKEGYWHNKYDRKLRVGEQLLCQRLDSVWAQCILDDQGKTYNEVLVKSSSFMLKIDHNKMARKIEEREVCIVNSKGWFKPGTVRQCRRQYREWVDTHRFNVSPEWTPLDSLPDATPDWQGRGAPLNDNVGIEVAPTTAPLPPNPTPVPAAPPATQSGLPAISDPANRTGLGWAAADPTSCEAQSVQGWIPLGYSGGRWVWKDGSCQLFSDR